MSHHVAHTDFKNPGSFKVSSGAKTIFAACALVGVASFAMAIGSQPERVWANFLVNYFYFLLLGLFGGFFMALQHVTNAYWSVTVRRLAEALVSYLPVAFVLGLVLFFFGRHHLYEWTHTDVVAHDAVLTMKSNYLNVPFWLVRLVGFFALWIALTFKMRSNSLAQDQSGAPALTLSNIKLGTAFLPLFAIGLTLTTIDLVMSLEPHWFSTMFGVYAFSGLFYSGLSLLVWLAIQGRRQGVLSDQIVNQNHLHDVGKLMFGFTVFWAYIMFDQLMLIWYANLPEETTYYLTRFNGGWWNYFWVLVTVHFFIPFFGLLPREAKRCESYLSKMALFMLAAQWMDAYYLVMPVFSKSGPVFGVIELGMFLGFFGVFALSVTRFLERVPAVPLKDPRIAQCLGHAQ